MGVSRCFEVEGRVQGVGFRPYVNRLATECALGGYVLNHGSGVRIVVEGDLAALEAFETRLTQEIPPLASIDRLQVDMCQEEGFEGFEICQSHETSKSAIVLPDMGVCNNCLDEMHDPADRRSGYWLINCTDCGPRYSIMQTVPYDRPHTSMRVFEMCTDCRNEYADASNRRYHAQPIGCYQCGPKLSFSETGEVYEGEAALTHAIKALKSGKIVAVKGLGGFHLMCNATDEPSVRLLRERKRRPAKPFAVMFPDVQRIRQHAELCETEAALIESAEKPVVLVKSKTGSIAPSVAPGIERLGVFLPYTPLQHRLFETIAFPLVATSANLSDEPIIRSEEELAFKLADVADGVLTHNREIVNACDDSVMQVVGTQSLMLRLARGFAPCTLRSPFKTAKKVLAVGGHQKSTVALAFEDKIVVSPHIGDLGSLEAFEYFERTLETFKRFYDFEPDLIVCDKHPGYETTKWAKAQGIEVLEVQHHYAHLLAVLAEHQIEEKVLGFAFDGTGYGDDGTIWGGEVLLADATSYERVVSLKPFRLIGGEKTVREPRRVALGLLFEHYSLDEVLALDIPTVKAFSISEIQRLHGAWQKDLNAPVTSSMGRLFDAVASLCGVAQEVTYEGESGLLLESFAGTSDAKPYGFSIEDQTIDLSPMLREIVVLRGEAGDVASRFMATVAEVMVAIARQYGMKAVFSGGVFQNRTLLVQVMKRFAEEGIGYYLPSRFPVNDGAVSLGQVWYAMQKERHLRD